MDALQSYDESMDITGQTGRDNSSIVKPFRTKTLFFAAFPWTTVIPMADSKLVEQIGDELEENHLVVSLSLTYLLRTF